MEPQTPNMDQLEYSRPPHMTEVVALGDLTVDHQRLVTVNCYYDPYHIPGLLPTPPTNFPSSIGLL